MRPWFSGRTTASQAVDAVSIPAGRTTQKAFTKNSYWLYSVYLCAEYLDTPVKRIRLQYS